MKKKDIILGILFSLLYYLIIFMFFVFLAVSTSFYIGISELSSKIGFILEELFPLLLLLSPLLIKFIFKSKLYQSILYSFLLLLIYIAIYYGTKQILMNRIIIDENGGVGEGTSFNGEYYDLKSFRFTEEGNLIGIAGGWKVLEVPEDKEHNFIVFRSFLDNWRAVKESYIIPQSGNINVVYIDDYRYTNEDIKNFANYLINEELSDNFKIITDKIYSISIYIGYEDCPVGTEKIGELCYINDKLVYIKAKKYNNEEPENSEELENNTDKVYTCYVVPEKYVKALKKVEYIPKNNKDI